MKLVDLLEAKDYDWTRDGWNDNLKEVWEDRFTLTHDSKRKVDVAKVSGKVVAEWDHKLNKGWIDTAVAEAALDIHYVVKRGKTADDFEVAKFDGRKQPDYVAYVRQIKADKFTSSSQGFSKVGQKDKTIVIVKQWINDGMPTGAWYTWDEKSRSAKLGGKIV